MHGLLQELVEPLGIREPHFPLGGVHVHVHPDRVGLDHEHRHREAVLHEQRPVAVLQAFPDHVALDVAAVDAEVLQGPVSPVQLRLPQKTGEPEILVGGADRQQGRGDLPAVQLVEDVLQAPVPAGAPVPAVSTAGL